MIYDENTHVRSSRGSGTELLTPQDFLSDESDKMSPVILMT